MEHGFAVCREARAAAGAGAGQGGGWLALGLKFCQPGSGQERPQSRNMLGLLQFPSYRGGPEVGESLTLSWLGAASAFFEP